MKLTAKAGDWSPYWSAAAVVSATTVEVWLDGIPHAKYSDGILRLFSVTGEFFCGEHGDIYAVDGGRVCEALPARAGDEPFLMGLNGAEPIYWGLALE